MPLSHLAWSTELWRYNHMDLLQALRKKIEEYQLTLGIIGLGYVGLPVACVFAQAGYRVIGVDVKEDRVATINKGHSPIEGEEPGLDDLLDKVVRANLFHATTHYTELAKTDVVCINVETPVGEDHKPHYEALKAACRSLGPVMKPGMLIIVESTVAPGTTDTLVRPLLEETSGLQANKDFFLGACPERVMPGKLLHNLLTVSRVCGGSTPETAEVMAALYRKIVHADLDQTNIITAELVKTTENAYRDVQIAFANEVALICEANSADVWHVRELVNKSPHRHMHLPGAGVGGHCIPKDPWLLAHAVEKTPGESSVPLRLIPAARAINDSMPLHVANLALEALHEAKCPIEKARIAVLGYAYLADSDDTRNSPSAILVEQLRETGADIVIHDPWVAEYQGDLLKCVQACDAAIVMVTHQAYCDMDLDALKQTLRTPILIDGRGMFNPEQVRAAGWIYRGVGRG